MKKIISIIIILIIIVLGGFLAYKLFSNVEPAKGPPDISGDVISKEENDLGQIPDVATIAENLTIPWDIVFLPNKDLLVTERPGRVIRISSNSKAIIEIPGVEHIGEGGLLGMVLHPKFSENKLLYLYVTRKIDGEIINSIERYVFEKDELLGKKVILEVPGARFHDGGRLAFGPDGYLYIATGDATSGDFAQNTQSLAGKILRVDENGGIPVDNPFGNAVYSYGHRNPQGLAWDAQGRLWSTEHGRSGALSGLDELNLIQKGNNYGWPDSEGDKVLPGTVGPIFHSGPDVTWAPASALYLNGSIFFGGLKGETLYEAVLSENGAGVEEIKYHFIGEFGRIRTIVSGPDGAMYLTTSNRDGRGEVGEGDDKIIRINPEKL